MVIKLSGKDLAKEFFELNLNEQAEFFNKNEFKKEDRVYSALRIEQIVEKLDKNGEKLIKELHDAIQVKNKSFILNNHNNNEVKINIQQLYDKDGNPIIIEMQPPEYIYEDLGLNLLDKMKQLF